MNTTKPKDIAKIEAKRIKKIWIPFGNNMSCRRIECNLNRHLAHILYKQLKAKYDDNMSCRVRIYRGSVSTSPRWVIVVRFVGATMQIECVTPMRENPNHVRQPDFNWLPPKSPNFAFYMNANFDNLIRKTDVIDCAKYVRHIVINMAKYVFDIDDITQCRDDDIKPIVFVGTLVPVTDEDLDPK